MKPVAFDYVRPATVAEAVAALESSDGTGKVIAGGQSLMPLLNMRLARPSLLVDINQLPLAAMDVEDKGLRLGAIVRQGAVLKSAAVARHYPLLIQAIRHVGHRETRSRGTVVGSLVHADPAAEILLAAVVQGARLTIVGPKQTRHVAIADFCLGYLMTNLDPDELVTAVTFAQQPNMPGVRVGTAFREMSRRHGDFALAAAAAIIAVDEEGRTVTAQVGVAGLGARPERLAAVESAVIGQKMDRVLAASAAAEGFSGIADGFGDLHGSFLYRKRVAQHLTETVLRDAWENATRRDEEVGHGA